jgi:predicted PhzF superfamily epimerase YddE/YHI9
VAAVLFARRHGARSPSRHDGHEGQRLELVRGGDDYFVRLAPQPVTAQVVTGTAAALLGVPAASLATPPRVASVGSPKLLVKVADTDALYALAPDLPAIAAWSKDAGVNGIYAWCRRDDGHVRRTQFQSPRSGLEDSATGVAAGALSGALGLGIVLRQGRATGASA